MQNYEPKHYSPFRLFALKFWRQRVAVVAGFAVVLIVLVGIFGPYLVPYDPDEPVDEQYAAKGIKRTDLSQTNITVTALDAGGREVGAGALPELTWSSEQSEVAKAAVTANGVRLSASSQGVAVILLRGGEASAALQVAVSAAAGEPILSYLTADQTGESLPVGQTAQLAVTGVLTDGAKLADAKAVEAYAEARGEKTEKKNNGFVTSGSGTTASGLRYESLTPAVVQASEEGAIRALREGTGLVKVTAGEVSTVAVVRAGGAEGAALDAADAAKIVRLVPSKLILQLKDAYKHQHPSSLHWFGTDHANRDIFSRIIAGTRQTLIIGFVSVFIGAFFGIAFGLIAGYYGRWPDMLISRGSDILLSFPGILLAIFVVAVAGPGMLNIILAVATFTVPIFIRIVRGSVLSLREMTYVEAARSIGVSDFSIIVRHIFPGTIPVVIIYLTMRIGSAILIGAGLSYLGLGGDVTAPEWGSMLSAAKNNSMSEFFPVFFPGAAIVVTVLSFNLLGDGLRDALDPKLKE